MTFRFAAPLLLALTSLAFAGPTVETRLGSVEGVTDDGIVAFRGIPYAQPPVGDLRWRPPQPVVPWSETLRADTYGPACWQPMRDNKPQWNQDYFAEYGVSEDCLTLNIWLPEGTTPDAKLPVMVYIHGSGWKFVSSSWPVWTGEELAREGVIFVNFNYRLGLAGRFAHPALSRQQSDELLANYNIMDQIAVLEWVQDNIAAFGGNPDNVTLFGHSAGGSSTNFLMATPQSAGLFQRAIAMGSGVQIDRTRHLSETGIVGPAYTSLEALGEELAAEYDISGTDKEIVAGLRALTPAQLNDFLAPDIQLNPVVDGKLLPDDLAVLFETGQQHNVPYITGVSDWEWNQIDNIPLIAKWFIAGSILDGLTNEDKSIFDDQWTRIGVSQQWFNNGIFFGPTRYLAKQMKNVPAPAWHYHVTYQQTNLQGQFPGAPHGLVIPFLFGHLEKHPEYNRPVPTELTEADFLFGDTARAYWINYAKTGDPNGPGLPEWPQFNPDAGQDWTLELGNEIGAREFYKKDIADHVEASALQRRAKFNQAR